MRFIRYDNHSDGTRMNGIRIFGRCPFAGSQSTPFDVWEHVQTVGEWPGTQSPAIPSFVSSSTEDADGGDGVDLMVVVGVGEDNGRVAEAVALNGTTPVNGTIPMRMVTEMRALNTAAHEIPVGNITASIGGTVVDAWAADMSRSMTGCYLFNSEFLGSENSGAGSARLTEATVGVTSEGSNDCRVVVELQRKPWGATWRTFWLVPLHAKGGTGTVHMPLTYPESFGPNDQFRARCTFREGAAGIMAVSVSFG